MTAILGIAALAVGLLIGFTVGSKSAPKEEPNESAQKIPIPETAPVTPPPAVAHPHVNMGESEGQEQDAFE